MLADTAVAVNPDDERYAGWSARGDPAAGGAPAGGDRRRIRETGVRHRRAEDHPGHDPNDFEIGRRHGLEEISVIGEDGLMTEAAGGASRGSPSRGAQRRWWRRSRRRAGSRAEPYTHTVPYSHRSGRADRAADLAPVVHADGRAGQAGDRGGRFGKVKFHPERWARVYLDWLENIRPWCISRQLWWGHRLPVWYCDACEETYGRLRSRRGAAPVKARCAATRTCSTHGSRRRCGR